MRGVQAEPGDTVELWGATVAVDAVAKAAGTLGYELLCAAGRACRRVYLPAPDSEN
jgi:alanine racemase